MRLALARTLLLPLLLFAAQVVAQQEGTSAVPEFSYQFTWSSPDIPAYLTYPWPEDSDPARLTDVAVEGSEVLSFSYHSNPEELMISLEVGCEGAEFDTVDLTFEDGNTRPMAVPLTRVEKIGQPYGGALRLERMTMHPDAGFALAAAVRNTGDVPLQLDEISYLPTEEAPGRLLVRVGAEPEEILELVMDTLTPGISRDWARGLEVRPDPPVEGFEWQPANAPNVKVPAGEGAMIIWLNDAFPAAETVDYRFSPVISYRTMGTEALTELGLPQVPRGSLLGKQ